MKRIIFVSLLLASFLSASAQDGPTDQGKAVIDINTTLGSLGGLSGGGTGFLLTQTDEFTVWNIGGEFGYFLIDNLAGKVGLGYGDIDGSGFFSWKVGAKYYAVTNVPIQVDVTGQSGDDVFGGDDPVYLGLQGGYAFFMGDMVSIEPTLRYAISLNDTFENVFQAQVGFSFFF